MHTVAVRPMLMLRTSPSFRPLVLMLHSNMSNRTDAILW
jgi:hypothetical protein